MLDPCNVNPQGVPFQSLGIWGYFKIIYTLSNLQFSAFKISKKVDTKADTEIDSSPWYKGRHRSGVVEQYLHLTSHLMNEEFQQIANADIMYADICLFNTWISWIGIYCWSDLSEQSKNHLFQWNNPGILPIYYIPDTSQYLYLPGVFGAVCD